MKVRTVGEQAWSRLRRPGTWGAVLLFGLIWDGIRALLGPDRLPWGEAALPFAFALLTLGCGALPWQWTGVDGQRPSFSRGLAQALPWNLLLALPLVLLALPGRGTGLRHGGPGPAFPAWGMPPRLWAILGACVAFGLLAGWILADRDQEARQAERAQKLAQAAQIMALQAQMNPHVLVNALSGMAELAREDGLAAESALVRLAELLRFLLSHTGKAQASLGEERRLLEALLELTQFRLGQRLQVRWAWDERLDAVLVPPLLVQPLVENAVKHGVSPRREGGLVEISLSGSPERLEIQVSNPGSAPVVEGTMGAGLANLRQRLALMDGFRGALDLQAREDRMVATLRLEARVHG